MVFRKSEVWADRFRKRLHLEPLESRRLLAGDVVAFLSGGNLKVHGDAEDNAIHRPLLRRRSPRHLISMQLGVFAAN